MQTGTFIDEIKNAYTRIYCKKEFDSNLSFRANAINAHTNAIKNALISEATKKHQNDLSVLDEYESEFNN